jgi:rfaE bifunctional protein nucleotidyltransferase chain/domain/rfaE bifunctional protein kinase chain/domain
VTRATGRPLVVVGDALLDRDLDGRAERLCPDAPVPVVDDVVERTRPGGAALAATLLALDGRDVLLVTALGRDAAGTELRALLERVGVDVADLGQRGATPEKRRLRAGGRPIARLDSGGRHAESIGPVPAPVADRIRAASGIVVADYGRGVADHPPVRQALASRPGAIPLVWDPHPRGASPVRDAALVTPNHAEARGLTADDGRDDGDDSIGAVAARAETLRRRWNARAVAVTRGERGALLATGVAHPLVVPAEPVLGGDVCGAGDRFATAALDALAEGAVPSEAVVHAVAAASSFVATGGAGGVGVEPRPAALSREPSTRDALAAVRARGGTVVATSGCFDLLHAGHVSALRAARALGDYLVVCLNSDASIRRLKGPDRPLVNERDRAALLRSLECVDGVVVFGEDRPVRVLEELRPDIFAKGGDYGSATLPETAVLARWGGQAVIVPYLEGRSTTRLVEEVRRARG